MTDDESAGHSFVCGANGGKKDEERKEAHVRPNVRAKLPAEADGAWPRKA
jgi:hypothetical protein